MNLAPLWIKGANPHLCIPSGKRGEITERGEGVRQQQRELLENAAAAGNEQQQELDKNGVGRALGPFLMRVFSYFLVARLFRLLF